MFKGDKIVSIKEFGRSGEGRRFLKGRGESLLKISTCYFSLINDDYLNIQMWGEWGGVVMGTFK